MRFCATCVVLFDEPFFRRPPLHELAYYFGRVDVFELLCAFTDDLNAVDKSGRTVLLNTM